MKALLCLVAAAALIVPATAFAEESKPFAQFVLTYRVNLGDAGTMPPGRYSTHLDARGNILVFDAEGEKLLHTLKPFMVDQFSRSAPDLRAVVEEGPGRPTYIRVYEGRRAAYFREFDVMEPSCVTCE